MASSLIRGLPSQLEKMPDSLSFTTWFLSHYFILNYDVWFSQTENGPWVSCLKKWHVLEKKRGMVLWPKLGSWGRIGACGSGSVWLRGSGRNRSKQADPGGWENTKLRLASFPSSNTHLQGCAECSRGPGMGLIGAHDTPAPLTWPGPLCELHGNRDRPSVLPHRPAPGGEVTGVNVG